MGNIGSSSSWRRNGSRSWNSNTPAAPSPSPEINGNRYVFAAATPYPPQLRNPSPTPNSNPNHIPYPNPPQFYQYANYYHPPPMVPLPVTEVIHVNWSAMLPCGPVTHVPTPYVEHQKAVTIRNDVNLKKETLRVEPDEQDPGKFLWRSRLMPLLQTVSVFVLIHVLIVLVNGGFVWSFDLNVCHD